MALLTFNVQVLRGGGGDEWEEKQRRCHIENSSNIQTLKKGSERDYQAKPLRDNSRKGPN